MVTEDRIPVVDVFAGPGGLGEGFAQCLDRSGRHRFNVVASFEKDPWAVTTLRIRHVQRELGDSAPGVQVRRQLYRNDLSHAFKADVVRKIAPAEWDAACESVPAMKDTGGFELGEASRKSAVETIKKRVRNTDREWILVGGPPCQAYSLVGRARNRGIADYRAEDDHRHFLYREFLHLVDECRPSVFVMENVKGLLSASVQNTAVFEAICEDFYGLGYELHSLVTDRPNPTSSEFILRMERYGIPQARHRLIIVGVAKGGPRPALLPLDEQMTVDDALKGLPRLRSQLSKQSDSDAAWARALNRAKVAHWARTADGLNVEQRDMLASALDAAVAAATGDVPPVGAEFETVDGGLLDPNWEHVEMQTVLHSANRGHIEADLHRYLFCAAWGQAFGTSPTLRDFPDALLPAHRNAATSAKGNGLFADRFRVQTAGSPSTTVTSHISKDGHYFIHPDPSQCRSLTVREAARLQTFPDDYYFAGPRTAQYHQVGNAVPARMAMAIAGCVWEASPHPSPSPS